MSSPRRLPVGTRLLLLVSAALLGIAALTAVFLVTERALIQQERNMAQFAVIGLGRFGSAASLEPPRRLARYLQGP